MIPTYFRSAAVALTLTLAAPVAHAQSFCGLPPEAWSATVAPTLDGAWRTETLSGLAAVEGDWTAMARRLRGAATFRQEGGALFLAPPDTPAEFELIPAAGENWDLSMEGEPPLPAETVFDDPTFGFGLPCPLAELPRYRTFGRLVDAAGEVEFTLYLVVPDATRVYAVTTATLDALDGTPGIARVVSRFTR